MSKQSNISSYFRITKYKAITGYAVIVGYLMNIVQMPVGILIIGAGLLSWEATERLLAIKKGKVKYSVPAIIVDILINLFFCFLIAEKKVLNQDEMILLIWCLLNFVTFLVANAIELKGLIGPKQQTPKYFYLIVVFISLIFFFVSLHVYFPVFSSLLQLAGDVKLSTNKLDSQFFLALKFSFMLTLVPLLSALISSLINSGSQWMTFSLVILFLIVAELSGLIARLFYLNRQMEHQIGPSSYPIENIRIEKFMGLGLICGLFFLSLMIVYKKRQTSR